MINKQSLAYFNNIIRILFLKYCYSWLFGAGSQSVVQAYLEINTQPRLTLNS